MSEFRISSSCEAPPDWDAFVQIQNAGTPFHSVAWCELLKASLKHDVRFFVARDARGGLAAALPLVVLRSRLFGAYAVSLPFVSFGGPLGGADAVSALCDADELRPEVLRVNTIELRTRGVELPHWPILERRVAVVLPLASTADETFKRFPAKLRSQVRKPTKDGLTFRIGGAELVEDFHTVFARHMRDLGTPALQRGFFEMVAREMQGCARIGCVYADGRPIAAGMGFQWHNTFEITWAAALKEHAKSSPNMLLYWELMKAACESGATAFDFGRCVPGSGQHRFKLQWGGHDVALPWHVRSQTSDAHPPDPRSARFLLAVRVWKQLPLPLANSISARVVRLLP